MRRGRQPNPGPFVQQRLSLHVSWIAAVWALLYAICRGHYAVGGNVGMLGTPTSESQWRLVNAVGAVILLLGAVTPLAMLSVWNRPRQRPLLLGTCWVVAVGCVMHALIDSIHRLLSLMGLFTFSFPFRASIDRRKADLQDLLFNESWFLIEGLLWFAIAWTAGLNRSPFRIPWILSAIVAVVSLTVVGVLSAVGVLGKLIIG